MAEAEHQRLARIKRNLERRALIFEFTRCFFREQGFLEVDTPIRMPEIAPEQYIVPFDSEGWFLATSPELHMKRLLSAGYNRIFQLSHCFRKEESGKLHNPEFTMLEWYRAGADYRQLVRDNEDLVLNIASRLGLSPVISYQGKKLDLTLPWPRLTVRDAFLRNAGWDPTVDFDPTRFDMDMVTKVMPCFSESRPTVLMDYPAAAASLSRLKTGRPEVAERVEVFMGGLELANGFSELNDSKEQTRRFRQEIKEIKRDATRKAALPGKFLKAITRLPECGGIALGMDRLVMLFCNAASIDEVMPFTASNA